MKKRLVVLIILMAIVTSLLFTSCTFIKENDERVNNSVLATVTYDYAGREGYFPKQTLSLTVTRSELVSYVNYVIYLYSNYNMEYDAQEVFDSSLDSLVTQKYQILEGMAYLMDNSGETRLAAMYYNTTSYKDIYGTTITPEGLLTLSERYSSIATTNETFVTSIDTFVTEYYDEIRELEITTAKENLTSHYSAGYAVDKTDADNNDVADGVKIAYKDGTTFKEGLYQSQVSSDAESEVDYTKVYLKITLTKSGEENFVAYLPVGEDAVTTAADTADVSDNVHITNQTATVTYEEPVKTTEEVTDEETKEVTTEEKTTYTTHTVTADYKLVTPRTAFKVAEDDTTASTAKKEAAEALLNKLRYNTAFETTDEEKDYSKNGQIFVVSPSGLDDATKDAYRQFREEKKSALIGFTTDTDSYNGLGYYYKSSFESAVLSAVQYELDQAALAKDPITTAQVSSQYSILAAKQKEEYDILSYEDQVAKFATTIGTDLSTCYYIPLDALLNTTYTYTDSSDVEHTRSYATLNIDGTYTIDMFYITHILFKFGDTSIINTILDYQQTPEDEEKAKKLDLILSVGLLKTNKSNENFSADSEKSLSDAYYVVLDGNGNPKLLDGEGNALSVEDQFLEENVKDIFTALTNELATVSTDAERLTIFKKYMVWYNDDGGAMTSKVGYLVGMGDVKHSYDSEDFPGTAKDIYIDLITDGIISNYLGTAFTSYGLHVEMISFLPFYNVNLEDLGNGLWVLGLDTKLDLNDSTFGKTIAQSVADTINTNTYSAWTSAIKKEEAESHCTRETKKIEKLAEDLGLNK